MNFPNFLTLTVGPLAWLIGSCLLLGFSMLVPEPTTAALGLAGLMTALVSLTIVSLPSQLLVWGVLSAAFTLIMRGLLPQESKALQAARTARVCQPIAPGRTGRVHYQGAIWHARCPVNDVAIAQDAQVAVVERQGNTLIVMPLPNSRSTTG